jgi:hypothetical protein
MGLLSDWTAPIKNFSRFMSGVVTPNVSPTLSTMMTSCTQTEQALLLNGLGHLMNAQTHASHVQFNKAILNITFMSFALCWFGLVNAVLLQQHYISLISASQGFLDFPSNAQQMINRLLQ